MRVNRDRLRALRERRVLSLRDLAERAGVGYVTIWRIEAGATDQAQPRTLRALAEALGVEPAELVAWDEEPGRAAQESRGPS